MQKLLVRITTLLISAALLLTVFITAAGTADTVRFILTDEEEAYLDSIRERPIKILYSYDLITAEFDGKCCGMLDPVLNILRGEFGLTVELEKAAWSDAFAKIDTGEADFYGPVAISEARRQKYVAAEPFYRSYSKIVTRTSEPIGSMTGLYNKVIGLLEGSVISRTMLAYLGPKGGTIYYPTMEEMIKGLRNGEIDAFATVDNAEFEILSHEDIRYELTIDNFFVEQGFIGGNEELRPLAELLSRYLNENPGVAEEITALRGEALLHYMRRRFYSEIEYLKTAYDVIPIFAEPSLYPLCYEENGVIKGMQIEINEVFTELTGIPVSFIETSDFRDSVVSASELLRTGEWLAAVGAYYSADVWNSPDVVYSPLLWRDTIRIYSNRDITGKLEGKRLGTTSLASDYLGWNNTTGNAPIIYDSKGKLLNALNSGEVDILFIGEMTFNYEYSIRRDYRLREITGLSAGAAMHLMYGAQNEEFNTVFNAAIDTYHILKPTAMGEWRSKSDKFKSDYIRTRYTRQIWITVGAAAFVVTLLALFYLMLQNLREHKKTISLMRILNERDVLTGIYNRRYMETNLGEIIHNLSRSGSPLSVFMVDIDYFKRYNDTYGHGKGDECLKTVAGALESSVQREEDFVARYGGEEFAVVLPHTDEKGARKIAEKMLNAVKSLKIPHEQSEAASCVSVSIGATAGTAFHWQKGADYLNRADEALYTSKHDGRNRYTFMEMVSGTSENGDDVQASENEPDGKQYE